MKLGVSGETLIKSFEGLYLDAYKDPVGIWTIGWGHTGLRHRDGTVFAGRHVSEDQAQDLFVHDMKTFEDRVNKLVKVPLNQNMFDALVSFDFNTGGLTLSKGEPSTLLKKLNSGDTFGAAMEFEKWNKAGGKELRGLTRRRIAERTLFCSFPV